MASSISVEAHPPATSQRWAWSLCWLMFAGTVLCYVDRQAISLVKIPIMTEFGLTSDESFGWIGASFGMAYALFQIPAGFLADRNNVRSLYAMAVAGWSLAGVVSAFSPTLAFLIGCRVALGIGESFNWPCALRITSRILPPSDRAAGNGIFNSGAAVGAVVTPLVVPALAVWLGWRAAFVMIGVLGFVWVGAWMFIRVPDPGLFSPPTTQDEGSVSKRLSSRALTGFLLLLVLSVALAMSAFRYGPTPIWFGITLLMMGSLVMVRVLPEGDFHGSPGFEALAVLVRLRRFWVLAVVGITVNVCWHFLVYWMASFLQVDRRLGLVVGGLASALPFLAADAGNLLGGGMSARLARRGWSLQGSRLTVMAVAVLLIGSGATIGLMNSTTMIVATLSVMALGTAAYMANYFALCQDVSPRLTGLVVGVLGGLSNLFASGFLPVAGRLKESTGGFGTAFVIVGFLPVVGVLTLAAGWGRDEAVWTERP